MHLIGTGAVVLRDHDYIKLQFMGARGAWLGYPDTVCDLRACPSTGDNYCYFNTRYWGEEFQVLGEGPNFSPIKSGQCI